MAPPTALAPALTMLLLLPAGHASSLEASGAAERAGRRQRRQRQRRQRRRRRRRRRRRGVEVDTIATSCPGAARGDEAAGGARAEDVLSIDVALCADDAHLHGGGCKRSRLGAARAALGVTAQLPK